MSDNPDYYGFYESVEDSIVERLAPVEDVGISVEKVPETASGSDRPFRRGLVTIAYTKSNFGDRHGAQEGSVRGPLSISEAVQQEELVIEVNIQGRTRRTHNGQLGSLQIIRIVRGILHGWKPAGCDKLFLREQGFVDFDRKAWEFAIVFGCHAYAVPKAVEDVVGYLSEFEINEDVQ